VTAQIEDTFLLDGEQFALKSNLSTLIHPSNWGIEPTMMHTGCYRGYYATVEVTGGRLVLQSLTVSSRGGDFPVINGVQPEMEHETRAVYSELDLKLPFSGALIAARDFDRRHYQHMGFHPPSAYKTVVVLQLDSGTVIGREDRQQDTDTTPVDRPPPPGPPPISPLVGLPPGDEPTSAPETSDGLMDWIRKRFTRP